MQRLGGSGHVRRKLQPWTLFASRAGAKPSASCLACTRFGSTQELLRVFEDPSPALRAAMLTRLLPLAAAAAAAGGTDGLAEHTVRSGAVTCLLLLS
jgi:hypothetical protein